MPRDSAGNCTRNHGVVSGATAFEQEFIAGTDVNYQSHDAGMNDVIAMLTDSFSRSGKGAMQANADMGGFRLTNVGNAINPSDAINLGQLAIGSWVPSYNTSPNGGFIGAFTTDNARFVQLGKLVWFNIKASFTISSGVNDNAITFTLPVAASNVNHVFPGVANYIGAAFPRPAAGILVSTSVCSVIQSDDNLSVSQIVTGVGRYFNIQGLYEAA